MIDKQTQTIRHSKQQGFSLVEVLIALIIMSVGMLGIASLYVQSMQAGRTSMFRHNAVTLAGDIADRIGGIGTLILGSSLQCLALLFYLPFDGLTSLYIVSALFGLSQGGIVPSYALIVRDYFPAHQAGARVSLVLMATILGMALGGWMSGAIFDLTGPTSDVGTTYTEGIRYYDDWLNENGGVDGQPVELLFQDYGYRVDQAEQLYSQFVQEGAVAFMGWGTGDTEALRGRVAQDQVPFMSAS